MSNFDSVFINGRIYTADTESTYVEAMAVKDGRISWIGNTCDAPSSDFGNVVDLRGKRVIPGIIDGHMHAIMLSDCIGQIPCVPPAINSIEEMKVAIRKRAKSVKPGEWIVGWGYDEGKLAEKRAPLKEDLDEAAPDNPVVIFRTCYHMRALNSMALKLSGIDSDTPDPVGGRIDKNESGNPTGILRESARLLVDAVMPEVTEDERIENMISLGQKLLSYGVTSITDLAAELYPTDYYRLYEKACENGLKQRVSIYYQWDQIKFMGSPVLKETRSDLPIRIGGVKLIGDGSVSGRTAWCDVPYLSDEKGCGFPVATEEDIRDAKAYARANGLQVKFHAMGARAIDRAVNMMYDDCNYLGDCTAVSIEHMAMPSEEALNRCIEYGIGMNLQPVFLFAEIESYLMNIGADRMYKTYPLRTINERGGVAALSSDAPATAWADPANPYVGIKSAVTRVAYDGTDTGASERIDVVTAVNMYTAVSQRLTGIPDVGRLAVGCMADFTVLDRDIFNIPAEEIDKTTAEETYISGNLVYRK